MITIIYIYIYICIYTYIHTHIYIYIYIYIYVPPRDKVADPQQALGKGTSGVSTESALSSPVSGSICTRRTDPVRRNCRPRSSRRHAEEARKGTNGVSTKGSLQISCFSTGTFGVLPLAYFDPPKSARAYLFPQSVKMNDFCSDSVSVDPVCLQPRPC